MLRLLAKTLVQKSTKNLIPASILKPATTYSDICNQNIDKIRLARGISIFARMFPESQEEDPVSSSSKVKVIKPDPSSSESVLDCLDDDVETLASLQDAYLEAQRDSTSKWLSYMKSCYIYLYRGGGEPSSALAAFDLDGTIIKPKSNKRIPKNATDWQFFSVWTKVKLQQSLRENQARFVIFTNQNGVGLKLVALEEVQERIELVTKRLNMPCTVFVAIERDEFRKPRTAMFQLFQKSFNPSKDIDLNKSFYCGDAVGYPSHSDADIKFAQTLGLPFLPPDKFVRGVKPKLMTDVKA